MCRKTLILKQKNNNLNNNLDKSLNKDLNQDSNIVIYNF